MWLRRQREYSGQPRDNFLVMQKNIIRLCYRKVIDAASQQAWDRHVFDSTYNELLLQSQFYNREKKYTSFSDMLLHIPAAEKLHFLVSAAVTGYLQQLEGKVPDILNSLSKQCLAFSQYHFEIIQSDTKNKDRHQVAIDFFTGPLLWLGTIQDHLLVTAADGEQTSDGLLTQLIALQPRLGIYSFKTETA